MNPILFMVRLVLAGVFAAAGIAKLRDRAGARQAMRDFGVPPALAGPLGVAVPIAELGCAVALVPAVSGWWGAVAAAGLLAVFTVAIAVNLAQGRTPACHCFGRIDAKPVGWTTLARNGLLLLLAGLLVARGPGGVGPDALTWWTGFERTDALLLSLTLGLGLLTAGSGVVLVQLLAQNGRLMLRVEALEGRLGAMAQAETAATESGLPLGSQAPSFAARDLAGGDTTLDRVFSESTSVALVFTEPDCGACDQTMIGVARWQREYDERLRVVVVSRGDVDVNRSKALMHGLVDVLLQADREISTAYQVSFTPSAVLVRRGRIASPLAVGPEGVQSLVFASTLPQPVSRGDLAPNLALPNLDGASVDIAGPHERETAVLFWNPGCSFCQEMLDDLLEWERTRPGSAPDLVVVSAGSHEVNRSQQLRSQVLLDPGFSAGHLLGASGTPSAVLLSADGRLASDVEVGAEAVFALLGRTVPQPVAST